MIIGRIIAFVLLGAIVIIPVVGMAIGLNKLENEINKGEEDYE